MITAQLEEAQFTLKPARRLIINLATGTWRVKVGTSGDLGLLRRCVNVEERGLDFVVTPTDRTRAERIQCRIIGRRYLALVTA